MTKESYVYLNNEYAKYLENGFSNVSFLEILSANSSFKKNKELTSNLVNSFELKNKDSINILILESDNYYDEMFSKLGKVYHSFEECLKKEVFISMIVFTGGEDVDPSLYGQQKNIKTYSNINRDLKEVEIFNMFRHSKILKVGICRGGQFLTVMNGGTLIQHVNNHNVKHIVESSEDLAKITNKKRMFHPFFEVTSSHHQMFNPYNLKEDVDFILLAWSEYFQSDVYEGEKNNENISLPSNFLEPEIVYYPKTNSLAIQGHPEWTQNSPFEKISLCLIENYNNLKK